MHQPGCHPSIKYILSASIIVVTIGVLIFFATRAGTQYFMTVDELVEQSHSLIDKKVRVSGAVIGDSIEYDPASFSLQFKIAQISGDLRSIQARGGLAAALHAAVLDPDSHKLQIVYHGIKPDLLKNETQAILSGQLTSGGIFAADEILLKCPAKYAEDLPGQAGK